MSVGCLWKAPRGQGPARGRGCRFRRSAGGRGCCCRSLRASHALQGKEVLQVLVDEVRSVRVGEHAVIHFVIQPCADHVRVFAVFPEDRVEPRDVSFCLVHALDGIPLGFLNGLLGLSACPRDGLVVRLFAFIDHAAPVLDCLVHVLEGVLHGPLGRHDVLQLHRCHVDAQAVGLVEIVHHLLTLQLDVGPFGADHVEDRTVPDQHVDHGL